MAIDFRHKLRAPGFTRQTVGFQLATLFIESLQYLGIRHVFMNLWGISGFPVLEGAITIENLWPGRESATDYEVGPNWYTDKSAPALFWRDLQGAETVYKWRQAVMEDWGKRLQYLKN